MFLEVNGRFERCPWNLVFVMSRSREIAGSNVYLVHESKSVKASRNETDHGSEMRDESITMPLNLNLSRKPTSSAGSDTFVYIS